MEMKLYDDHGQEVNFYIDDNIERILVSCSGGADSAILFYILCDYLQRENRTNVIVDMMSFSNDFKWRWNGRKAADIVNYTIDKLGFDQFGSHTVHYIPVQDSKYWQPVQNKFFVDYDNALVMSGETCNPKSDAGNKYLDGWQYYSLCKRALPERDSNNVKKPLYKITKTKPVHRYMSPFSRVDKRFVASMFQKYGVWDMLALTRSCEGVPPKNTPYYKDFEDHPCHICWWCLERKWAFGEF
jgi:hypothetical protein